MSQLHLRIFDGTRQPFPLPAQFLITITDGYKKMQNPGHLTLRTTSSSTCPSSITSAISTPFSSGRRAISKLASIRSSCLPHSPGRSTLCSFHKRRGSALPMPAGLLSRLPIPSLPQMWTMPLACNATAILWTTLQPLSLVSSTLPKP